MNNLPESYLKKCRAIPEFKENPPNLEQLIDLYRNIPKYKEVNLNDLDLLSKMRCCLGNLCCANYIKHQSMHDFWLMAYMKEAQGKEWYDNRNQWL